MVWETLDELAHEASGRTREVLERAATAILSEEALGAHTVDRNEERVHWIIESDQRQLAGELGVEAESGFRRRVFKRR